MGKDNNFDLKAGVYLRNQSVWGQTWEGLSLPELAVLEREAGKHWGFLVSSYLATIDEELRLKQLELDQINDLSQAEIEQERQLAWEKYETERQKLSIRMAAEEYFLAAKQYETQVKAVIMAAREYAAEMEREQALLEKARAELAVEKEQLRTQDLTAQVFLQAVERAMVEADVAKLKLQAARARVDIVEAEVAARRAEVALIEADVKEAMAEAERADLLADVASIFAQVVVKQLAPVKLDVETKEIEAGFRYIQAKLDDMLRLWSIREQSMEQRGEAERKLLEELGYQIEEEKREQQLRIDAVLKDRQALQYEIDRTFRAIGMEQLFRERVDRVKRENLNQKLRIELGLLNKNLWAEKVINAARRAVTARREQLVFSNLVSYEFHSQI